MSRATNPPTSSIDHSPHPDVAARGSYVNIQTSERVSEFLDTLRDAASEPRYELEPHGDWFRERNTVLEKRWRGYGCVVTIESAGVTARWSVDVTDDNGQQTIAESVSRLEAFLTAAKRMRSELPQGDTNVR